MKKIIFCVIAAMCSVSSFVYSQNVSIKKKIAYVDGKEFLKLNGCGGFDSECSILNLNNDELIFIQTYPIPNNSRYGYQELKFLGLNKSIELQKSNKDLIKLLYNSKAINEDGSLNPESVDRLVEKYEHTYTGGSNAILIR